MRATLLIALIATLADAAPRVYSRACDVSSRRSDRGGVACGAPYAFFEFAPLSGVGMPAACVCLGNPTSPTGQTLTFTRATAAWCTKGNTLTGIVGGDMKSCAIDVARIGTGGTPGLKMHIEAAATNGALQSLALDNVVWTSTEPVTPNTTISPSSAVSADTLNDTSAVAQSCTTQVIATTSATMHTASVYLQAGTLAKAQLTMVGAGDSAGDCTASTTTLVAGSYDRINCTSPAAYGAGVTSVTLSICVGTDVADIGTVVAWGANHVVSAVALTSVIPAAGVPVARAADRAVFAMTWPAATGYSMMTTIVPPAAWRATNNNRMPGGFNKDGSNDLDPYIVPPQLNAFSYVAGVAYGHIGPNTPNTPTRAGSKYDGVLLSSCVGGTCTGTARAFTMFSGATNFYLGAYSGATGYESNAWHGQVCLSPTATGCLP